MSIHFSEKFRQLRRDKDLTQEQIADIFNISPQAVSRWETGTSYPDIEILPHLAIFFNITVDELLGTEEIRGAEKVKEYVRDIRNLLNSGRINEAAEMARKAVKEYPANYGEQYYLLSQALSVLYSKATESEKTKIKQEIITVSERAISNDPNNWDLKAQLVQRYASWGMKEEAKRVLATMPWDIWSTQEIVRGCILDGDEWIKHQQARIVRLEILLEHFIGGYISKGNLSVSKRIEWKKAQWQIKNLINPIYDEGAREVMAGGDSSNTLESAFHHIELAELYCEAGDVSNALNCIEQATQDSLHHIDVMDKTTESGANYIAWSTPRNLPWLLWEDHLTKSQFDIIRKDESFITCFELLKANSYELKH